MQHRRSTDEAWCTIYSVLGETIFMAHVACRQPSAYFRLCASGFLCPGRLPAIVLVPYTPCPLLPTPGCAMCKTTLGTLCLLLAYER